MTIIRTCGNFWFQHLLSCIQHLIWNLFYLQLSKISSGHSKILRDIVTKLSAVSCNLTKCVIHSARTLWNALVSDFEKLARNRTHKKNIQILSSSLYARTPFCSLHCLLKLQRSVLPLWHHLPASSPIKILKKLFKKITGSFLAKNHHASLSSTHLPSCFLFL